MKFDDLLESRRSYRLLKPVNIDEKIINQLATSCRLAPSCYNNQPWQFIFVTSPEKLRELRPALSKGNEWAYNASLVVAVFSNKDLDCIVAKRKYYLFDTGIAAGFLLLAATDLGLVAHPIAGFSESKAKNILKIPETMKLITLIMIGEHDKNSLSTLSDENKQQELIRPERKPITDFIHINEYKKVENE